MPVITRFFFANFQLGAGGLIAALPVAVAIVHLVADVDVHNLPVPSLMQEMRELAHGLEVGVADHAIDRRIGEVAALDDWSTPLSFKMRRVASECSTPVM